MTEVIEKTEYKKGYKKTKLGWIPEEWDVVKFKDIGQSIIGLTYSPNDIVEKGLLVLRSSNIKDSKVVYDDNVYVSKKVPKKLITKSNDILMCVRNGSKNLVGKSVLIKANNEGYTFGAFMSILRSKYNSFLYQFLQSSYAKKQYTGATSATINQITSKDLDLLQIPFPKIQEQEKIAEILSAWDVGIETLEKLIEQKEILHKALMKNLLMGKKRLSEFCKNIEYKRTKFGPIPVDWQLKPLKLLFDKRMQKYSGNTEHNIFTNSATKGVVLQNEYFDRSIVTEENASNYYIVGENDFMYNPRISQSAPAGPINRNKLGITGIASPLYTIFKAKHDTIVDFYEQYFSSNLWNNSMFMVANQGARHDRLNITNNDFMNMPLPYPPLKEQKKIANVLIESYKEIQILNSKLEKLKEQKKGLMQKLLTGQIRVKV